MKIVLANLPWYKNGKWGVKAGSRWPHLKTETEGDYQPFPFYLAYAAALLRQEGYEIKIVDALAEKIKKEEFLKLVAQIKPDLLLAETSTVSLLNDLEILRELKDVGSIALAGPDINIRQEGFFKNNPFIDFVLIGEYEYTLLDLVNHLNKNQDLKDVLGLHYCQDGEIIANPPRPLTQDLDTLPWPLREELPMDKYLDAPGEMPLPSVQMWASRGCPFSCIFCMWPQLMYGGSHYRVRQTNKVVEEMEYLVQKMGFRSIYFDDDTFNIGKERMLELCHQIKQFNNERRLNIPWAIMARADLMDEKILQAMKEAGAHAIKYGVESAVQELVDKAGKEMDLKKADRMIRFTKSLGIKVHLTFTFGLPGETKDTIRKSLDYLFQVDPDSAQFSIVTPFPGTKYYYDLEKNGYLLSQNWADYDGNYRSVLKTEHLTARALEEAVQQADEIWGNYVRKRAKSKWLNKPIKTVKEKWGKKERIPQLKKELRLIFAFWKKSYFLQTFVVYFKNYGLIATIKKTFKYLRPANFINHYLEIMGILDKTLAYRGPQFVQIDLTNRCNNNCLGCWCNSPLLSPPQPEEAKKQELPLELVKKVLDEVSTMKTQEIAFVGGGEPLMYSHLWEVVNYVKNKGLKCYITTNFTLSDNQIIKRIIDSKIDQLTVSIWAATPETYQILHPNKDKEMFYQIRNNLKLLNSLKKRLPEVKICNVILNKNYKELVSMVDLAKDVKADALEFSVLDSIPGSTDSLALSIAERDEALRQCDGIRQRFKHSRIDGKIVVYNFDLFCRRLASEGISKGTYDKELLAELPCYTGWAFARIEANGNVNSCLKSHRYPVGNIYQQSFKEIWNSEKQQTFRKNTCVTKKQGYFFSLIGNDPQTEIGCYRVCDDLYRNMRIHHKMLSLTTLEKSIFRFLSKGLRHKNLPKSTATSSEKLFLDCECKIKDTPINDEFISHKTEQLRQIYQSTGWKLTLKLIYLKRNIYIFAKRCYQLIIIIFLFFFTLCTNVYLYLLKKIRGRIIFPGG